MVVVPKLSAAFLLFLPLIAQAYWEKQKFPSTIDESSLNAGTEEPLFLKTTRLKTGFIDAGQEEILIITAETRDLSETLLQKSAPGRFTRLGKGHKWGGFKDKVHVVQDFLNDEVAKNPNKLIIFIDSDVFFAKSCPAEQILEEYNFIKRTTGARIVFGAELNCHENYERENEIPKIPKWALDSKPQLNPKLNAVQNFTDRPYPQTLDFSRYGMHGDGLKYLNSGNFIGPAIALKEMVDEIGENFYAMMSRENKDKLKKFQKEHVMKPGDQYYYWHYFLDHKDKVTLDYRGRMFQVMSFYDIRKTFNFRGKNLYNKFLQEDVCFAHFPGHSKEKFAHEIDGYIRELNKHF
eukprot:CAMPEP_0185260870 /NCGR_PEP_ID=MMETSP1359-20130426/9400_1 /TAXON_ID=552665 /ORGANISM="Bigelowiella longifila, Strain CCMP242" /LENGTH=349 /DNA_ID=CAMNT_0027847309 /DNA_START=32 /DNA_END=1081 /DNA_ORIENTATION=-